MHFYPTLKIKKGKEGSVYYHHPWVFSGALHDIPDDLENGDFVHVQDEFEKIIGTGSFSRSSSIAVRLFDFKEVEINEAWLTQKITLANDRRLLLSYGPGTETTGYRVVFAESDGLPGLILDRFENTLVLQISTAGMEKLKPILITVLEKIFAPTSIIEKSELTVRKEEKLPERKELISGTEAPVEFLENGNRFIADVWEGQKTGFFTDQKELRTEIEKLASKRNVLDLFSYSGAAGIYALRGGASAVDFVDGSESALELCKQHVALNKFNKKTSAKKITYTKSDVFEFLGKAEPSSYDMVIVDPPALIKTHRDEMNGKKAYHFLNRAALRLVKDGGIFVSSSCSHFLSEEDFLFMLRRAAVQAGVTLHLLHLIRQSPDHPESLNFPESRYLKSIVAWVETTSNA